MWTFFHALAPDRANIRAAFTTKSLLFSPLYLVHLGPKGGGLLCFLKEPFQPSQQLVMRVRHRDTGTARIAEVTPAAQDVSSWGWGSRTSFVHTYIK